LASIISIARVENHVLGGMRADFAASIDLQQCMHLVCVALPLQFPQLALQRAHVPL
jgi:hypothetical protein